MQQDQKDLTKAVAANVEAPTQDDQGVAAVDKLLNIDSAAAATLTADAAAAATTTAAANKKGGKKSKNNKRRAYSFAA